MAGYISSNICVLVFNYGRDVTGYDVSVLNSLVTQTMFVMSIAEEIRHTEDAFNYTIYALSRAAEANDEDTGNHILRVGAYCALLSENMGMPSDFVKTINLQAAMHDVGKIHIHPNILRKPGKLTTEEFEEMKKHVLTGVIMILGEHQRLSMARNIALTHHGDGTAAVIPKGLRVILSP